MVGVRLVFVFILAAATRPQDDREAHMWGSCGKTHLAHDLPIPHVEGPKDPVARPTCLYQIELYLL